MPRGCPTRPIPWYSRRPRWARRCRRRRRRRSAARRRAASGWRCFLPARNSSGGDAMIGRRDALRLLAGGGAIGAFTVLGLPGAVFAAAPGERRLIVVLLRGALDGLAAVAPLGELSYAARRGTL